MCNPLAIAGMQVMATAQQAKASIDQGSAEQSYYNYLATQNDIQAGKVVEASNINVGLVSGAAAREEQNLERTVSTVKGTQVAAAAANGVYAGSKTSEDIARDTDTKAALDKAAIRENAYLQSRKLAYDANNQVSALKGQASSLRIAGINAMNAAKTNAFTSVLNGATNVASTWYKWKQISPSGNGSDPLAGVYRNV